MREQEEICAKQISQLDNIINKSKLYLKKAPEGTLRTNRSHNSIQYYWRTKDTGNHGKYIRRSEENLAKALAQKDYVLKVLPVAIETRKAIEQYNNAHAFQEIDEVYKSLSKCRQELVEPFVLSEEKYVGQWVEKQRNNKNITQIKYGLEDGILTEKGELVRSKSEKIIADKFYKMGVPYMYECPLYLKGYGTVYPDFTVLNKRTREDYYWEHLGMMDEPSYAEKAIKKLELYEKNGIYQGKKLILSYETMNYTPNMKVLEGKIQTYLL